MTQASDTGSGVGGCLKGVSPCFLLAAIKFPLCYPPTLTQTFPPCCGCCDSPASQAGVEQSF